MRIVAVMDIMNHRVVRGMAGRRETYRPWSSPLSPRSDPLEVARAFRDRFALTEIYLADLDAISGSWPDLHLYTKLVGEGFHLWVDAGLKQASQAEDLVRAGVGTVVAGLETIAGPESLRAMVDDFGPDRIVFSLDLMEGRPLGTSAGWIGREPLEIAAQAVDLGVRRLLVLDLSRVGVGSGTGTEDFCRECRNNHPEVEIAAGGGIRGEEDLRRLQECGVEAALAASMLHEGKFPPRPSRKPDSDLSI